MERRPPRLRHAVHGPDAAVLLEVRRDRRMPVLRVDDRRALGAARSISAFTSGTTSSPPRTYRLPTGSAKSFWTSTTTSAVWRSYPGTDLVWPGGEARSGRRRRPRPGGLLPRDVCSAGPGGRGRRVRPQPAGRAGRSRLRRPGGGRRPAHGLVPVGTRRWPRSTTSRSPGKRPSATPRSASPAERRPRRQSTGAAEPGTNPLLASAATCSSGPITIRGLQVVRRQDGPRIHPRHLRHRRSQRVGQVEPRRRDQLGPRRAGPAGAARRPDGRRDLRRDARRAPPSGWPRSSS